MVYSIPTSIVALAAVLLLAGCPRQLPVDAGSKQERLSRQYQFEERYLDTTD